MGRANDSASASFSKRAGQWLTYALFRCIECVLWVLPITTVWYVGRVLGGVTYFLAGKYRRLALHNLHIAFGREKSPAELRRLAHEHFKSLFANMLCGFKMPLMTEAEICKRVRSDGTERAQAAFDDGERPLMNLVLHASCWEILTQVPAMFVRGHKAGAIYQPLRNPWLNALVLRRRKKLGYALFDRQDGFTGPMKFMREGGQVGVLVDQHAGDHGIWCPFFDRLASTTTIAALMAIRTKAVVLPMMVYNDGPARWRLHCAPAVVGAGGRTDADSLTLAINAAVEGLIREQPEAWFWVHNRWKTPKPYFLLPNYRRGVAFPMDYDMTRLQPFELLIRSPNWLGDACMAFPMVRAIKRGRPDLKITVLGPDKLEELWLSMPEVSRYIGKPAKEGLFAVAKRIKATGVKFDAAVLCTNSTRSTLEIWLAGIPRRVGYKGSLRSKLLNQIIKEPKNKTGIEHHAHRYMRIAQGIGADIEQPGLWDAGTPPVSTDGTLRVGVCAGAEYGPAKRWPLERFAAVVNQISAQHAQFRWELFGAPGEKEMGEKLSAMLQAPHENLVGKTRLSELIARLRQCQLLLTNDTGTMHLAAALGIPTVSIFGSTCPIATGPLGERHTVVQHKVPCSPCFERECPFGHYDCMTKVTPDEVAQAVLKACGVGKMTNE
ncbi:lipopolysaccharide heptosyltransferase II [Prosthecobacter vanneervenii]|uniref:lipopolysaccharide heptosyltransferase II n=1 Tax=Prosthecobacter vanneervenii TaxID=48466 RepID=A0A7W8DLR2_9BACT|nr:lipopolysaccharide heptosyltransferase II [Prosthecobacter vanneervenii]MBB5034654.1 lipopolysaccharide heptosyltransferase II [Prosthecobacter vanneervenii]